MTLFIMIHVTLLLVLVLVLHCVRLLARLVVVGLALVLVLGGVEGVADWVVTGVTLRMVFGLISMVVLNMTLFVVVSTASLCNKCAQTQRRDLSLY